jgi:hypothetical protein
MDVPLSITGNKYLMSYALCLRKINREANERKEAGGMERRERNRVNNERKEDGGMRSRERNR